MKDGIYCINCHSIAHVKAYCPYPIVSKGDGNE